MRIKRVVRSVVIGLAAAVLPVAGVVATASPAQAFPTKCKELKVIGESNGWANVPYMTVPICYNGSRVRQNGGVTPGVVLIGWYSGGFGWYGTYNSGGDWLGAGENYSMTTWNNFVTLHCSPRWIINSLGNVINYKRNC